MLMSASRSKRRCLSLALVNPQYAHAHCDRNSKLLLLFHLQAPNNLPRQEGKRYVHCRGVCCGVSARTDKSHVVTGRAPTSRKKKKKDDGAGRPACPRDGHVPT